MTKEVLGSENLLDMWIWIRNSLLQIFYWKIRNSVFIKIASILPVPNSITKRYTFCFISSAPFGLLLIFSGHRQTWASLSPLTMLTFWAAEFKRRLLLLTFIMQRGSVIHPWSNKYSFRIPDLSLKKKLDKGRQFRFENGRRLSTENLFKSRWKPFMNKKYSKYLLFFVLSLLKETRSGTLINLGFRTATLFWTDSVTKQMWLSHLNSLMSTITLVAIFISKAPPFLYSNRTFLSVLLRIHIRRISMFLGLPDPHLDSLIKGPDPRIPIRIRIRTKISRIRNTAFHFSFYCCRIRDPRSGIGDGKKVRDPDKHPGSATLHSAYRINIAITSFLNT